MAKKTIGKDYLLGKDDGPYQRGIYYFGKYCENCTKKVYLTHYEAQDFVYHASPSLDKRSFWLKLWKKIPRIRFVVEKGSGEQKPSWYGV